MANDLIGKSCRVTGRVGPGTVGEVILSFDGGTNTYFAKPADGTSTYEQDETVSIVEFSPPQTLYVAKAAMPYGYSGHTGVD
jgi:hypothetical protein